MIRASQTPSGIAYQSVSTHLPVRVQVSRFVGASGSIEMHFTACPTAYADIETQLSWLEQAWGAVLDQLAIARESAVVRRLYCSDLQNQLPVLQRHAFSRQDRGVDHGAVTWIGQTPAAPAKVALWSQHIIDPLLTLEKQATDHGVIITRQQQRQHWNVGLTASDTVSAYDQTHEIFANYIDYLVKHNLNLAEHVVRTWLYVRDIEQDYGEIVRARRELFAQHGLAPDTHYIASTGIESAGAVAGNKLTFDAYAIEGLQSEQVHFLTAPEYLGRTDAYGVTFERGTRIDDADRSVIFISGTASIDAQGEILHLGDVERQLQRTLANFDALLRDGGASARDMAVLIAYVRDLSDAPLVRDMLSVHYGDVPLLVVAGAVCRPGWLVEIEGQAIVS